jgi:hypothetical protein
MCVFWSPTIAQAVSRRLPNAAAWVRFQVRKRKSFCRRSGIVVEFVRVLPFPLPILIPLDAPYLYIIWDEYSRFNNGLLTNVI